MIVVDNSQYLIEQIQKKADLEKKKLEENHLERVENLRAEAEKYLKEEIKILKDKHETEMENLRKQMKSNFELNCRKELSQKRDEVFERLIQRMKKNSKDKIVKVMMKRLGKMKSYEVPKGVKIAKTKDTLNDFSVIGHSAKESFEINFEDLINENMVRIREITEEKLIKDV